MTALAASLLVMLVNRPEPQVIERIVEVPVERPAAVASAEPPERNDAAVPSESAFAATRTSPTTDDSYLRLRGEVLALGVDSWMRSVPPAAASGAEAPVSYRELRESLLQ